MLKFDKPFIQVAGIRNGDEAGMLIDCGVRYLGFPLRLDYHMEDIPESEVREIIRRFPPDVFGVLITYLDKAEEIVKLSEFLGTSIVQIHGSISFTEMLYIKELNPEIQIIKSLIVQDNNLDVISKLISECEQLPDAFITDTYDSETGASGATGKTHNWDISRKIIEITSIPVILAGGLNPDNVSTAIQYVKPAGVDVHTGVEDKLGNKDKNLVLEFVSKARQELKS